MVADRTRVYLFAGDSLTEGVHGESYVERIARAMAEGWTRLTGEAVNAGRGGDTVRALLERIDVALKDSRPDCVVLAIGTNDVWLPWLSQRSLSWWLWLIYRRWRHGIRSTTDLDRFAALYRALIDRVRAAGVGQVLVCAISPVGEDLSSPLNRQAARLNGVIKRVAMEVRVPVADVWQAFVGELAPLPRPSRYLPRWRGSILLDRRRLRTVGADALGRRRRLHLTLDGVHLNGRGADLWAGTVLSALERM